MNSHVLINSDRSHSSRQGSSLMIVMIIMFLVSLAAASLLTLGIFEKDLTYRRVADVEARFALESAIEVAMADLQQHFREAQSITSSTPSIALSPTVRSQIVGNTRYLSGVRITSIENRQHRQPIFVDALDPDTLLDPHRGTFVRVSEWVVNAEVDVNYRGQTRQVRAQQSFQVRESPFFTHAILYNMDLEFHPGPAMIINGPVHSNARIWAVALNSLHFLDRVTATEGIHMGAMMEGKQDDWSNGYLHNQSGGNVWFNTNRRRPDGALSDPPNSGLRHGRVFASLLSAWAAGNDRRASSYFDARSVDSGKLFNRLEFVSMSEFLSSWFDGNVAMGTAEAPRILPPGMPDYVADDGDGNRLNHGYALIEPLLPPHDPLYKGEGEREKFAFKAGLTLQTRFIPNPDPDVVQQLMEDNPHWRRLKDHQGNDTDYWMIPQRIRRSNPHDLDTTVITGNGVAFDPVYIREQEFDLVFRAGIYDEDGNGRPVQGGGLYDKRDLKPQDLVIMDMERFRTEIVETEDLSRFELPTEDGSLLTFNPANHYNGVVYFQIPIEPTTRPDNIAVARDNFRPFTTQRVDNRNQVARDDFTSLSLFVTNSRRLPNPDYNQNRSPGFTLAANSRVYLHGSFNADGNSNTGSSTSASGEPDEFHVLAAVAADAITFLTDNFTVVRSKDHDIPSGSFTEVNAALMSGILPTNSDDFDSRYSPRHEHPVSGGSHNYHRFLENMGTFRYRGSMVAFYEAELARSPQEQSNNTWYGAPRREYGFYDVFGTGLQPPGTPTARTFFKLDFRFN